MDAQLGDIGRNRRKTGYHSPGHDGIRHRLDKNIKIRQHTSLTGADHPACSTLPAANGETVENADPAGATLTRAAMMGDINAVDESCV
jgi:hypothetical protein